MTWKCADCNTVEDGKTSISAVCHHCGKPLCGEDQQWIADDAFHAESRLELPAAAHCKSCQKTYHPRADLIVGTRR